jgi:hypothetical protein
LQTPPAAGGSGSRPSRTSLPALGSPPTKSIGGESAATYSDAVARLSHDIRAQHPFIRRVQSQTACHGVSNSNNNFGYSSNSNKNSNSSRGDGGRKSSHVVAISPSQLGPGQELSMSTLIHNNKNNDNDNDYDEVDDSCRRPSSLVQQQQHCSSNSSNSDPSSSILRLAAGSDNNNLCSQTESVLSSSSLVVGAEGRPGLPSSDSSDEDEPARLGGGSVSLGSDIESNIRRLERTQAKINAALETFRFVVWLFLMLIFWTVLQLPETEKKQ